MSNPIGSSVFTQNICGLLPEIRTIIFNNLEEKCLGICTAVCKQ